MRRTFIFDVSCPASTPEDAPVSADISIPAGWFVDRIQIVIPDGHAGLTGIALAIGHGQVLPSNAGGFIEGNDEEPVFEFTDQVGSGSWQALMYNGDLESQPWQVRLSAELPVSPQIAAPSSDQTPADLMAGLTDLGAPGPGPPGDTGAGATGDLTGGGTLPPEEPGGGPPGVPEPPVPEVPEPAPPDLSGDQLPPDLTDGGGDVTGGDLTLTGPDLTPPDTGPPAPSGGVSPAPPPSGGAPIAPPRGTRYATRYRVVPVYQTVTLPAGGWLPAGARFTLERIDQGQDFITDWQGGVIAPGDGTVSRIGSDRPFPDGFGPAYPIVQITTGRWAGHEYYVGHCTTAVRAGQAFKRGDVLARADQGHVQDGGWCELGLSSALGAGLHDQGAALAGLWGPVTLQTQTGTRRIAYRVAVRTTTAPKRGRGATPPAGGKRAPGRTPPRPPAPRRTPPRPAGRPAPPPGRRAPAPRPPVTVIRRTSPPPPPPPPPPRRPSSGGAAPRPPAARRGRRR